MYLSNIELNGRWLQVTACSSEMNDRTKIYFKDSWPLLSGKLAKLCKDFEVEHQKLTETVSHDDITLDNWNTFPELPQYLENDVKGLYEVLEKFNDIVWEATLKEDTKRETKCRAIFEAIFKQPFPNTRGVFNENKRLELDGYNSKLGIAFEYQGEQHYEKVDWCKCELEEIQKRDALKAELCLKYGIRLIIIPYLTKDIECFIRHHAEFDGEIKYTLPTQGINMVDCLTGASLAKKMYFHKFYDRYKLPVYKLTREVDDYIRSGYRGGRVEIFHMGRLPGSKFNYYDFTSLYPSQMLNDLPYDKPSFVQGSDIDICKFFGFIRCRVTTIRRDIKPLHGILQNHKYIFPFFNEPTEINLFSEEIKLGMRYGIYKYEFLDGYNFKQGPLMKKFVNMTYKNKQEATENKQEALRQTWKIIINSSYGFWGLRTRNRDGVKIYAKGNAPTQKYLEQGKLKSEADIGNYSLLRVESDMNVSDFNVSVSAATSSYSRMRLWELINDIEKKGEKVFMCDTDSVITSITMHDYPDLMEKYMWDGTGEELGSLKNELGGTEYATECILGGAKFYSLRNENYETCKCKGFNGDMTFKNFEDENFQQRQLQFRCGLANYVSESNSFQIKKSFIDKKVRFQYSKGIIQEDNSISPLEVGEYVLSAYQLWEMRNEQEVTRFQDMMWGPKGEYISDNEYDSESEVDSEWGFSWGA